MAAPVAGLFATLGLDDGPWSAGLRRASQQARDFQSQQERSFRSVAAATDGFGRSMRGALGGVAQQVQDVAVQFQSGTSAAIIFAQQGPQILGAFGPVGATIGALAGVTAVAAGAMLGYGREVDTAKAASDALETATHGLDGTIAGSADSVADLTSKYRALSDEMRTIERLSLGKRIRENEEALVAIRDQIAASVQAAKDSGQLALLQQSEALARLDPGAVRDQGVAQLQQFLEGLDTALSRSAKGGLTEFADQVDRLVTGLPEAGSDARKLADSFIAPAEGAIKAANSIKQAQAALDGLAGKPIDSKGGDPFAGFKDAPKELERVREDIQRGLDSIAKTVAEKKRVVDREFAETFAAIGKQRSVPGADQHLLDEVEAQAKKLHAARLARIDEEAAKEAENERKRGESARKRTDAVAREIEQNQRLIEAGKQGADAYEAMRRVIEAENKAIAAGLDPKGREAALLAEQTRLLDEQSEARKRNARAVEEQVKAVEDFYKRGGGQVDSLFDAADAAAKEAERDRLAEQERSVENLQRNLQTNVASAIERGFEDGFGSVGDLVDQFGSLLKSTVATALADQLVTKAFAESLSGALGTKIGELVPSLAGTGAGEATVGGAATAGLGAALGGYAIGQSTGDRRLGALGGAAGGAAAGFAVGGPYGAAAGALIGGIAGFIGGGATGGERNNNFQAGFDPLTGLPVEFQNTKPDPQNQSAVASVLAELAALREGLRATGVAFGDIGDLVVQAGNRTGLTLNGEKYGSQSALTEAALRQLLTGAEGLTADQQTVLEHSKATTAQGLLTDLSIPEQLANLRQPMSTFATGLKDLTRVYAEANDNAVRLHLSTDGLAEAQERDRQRLVDAYRAELGLVTPLQQAIGGVTEAFASAIRSSDELGVSEQRLVAERDRQIGALVDAYKAQLGIITPLQAQVANINDQWAQARRDMEALGLSERQLREARADALAATRNAALAQLGFISPLQQQIMAIQKAFEEAAKSAEFLGKSEAELAQQRDKLIRQALDQQREALRGQVANAFSFLPDLQRFGSNVAISGAAGATRLDQFQALQAEYNRTFRLARGGDTAALGQIDDLGQQLLALGRDVYASGPQFAALQERITGGIGDLAERFGQLQKDSFAELGNVFTTSLYQQTRELVAELRELRAAQERMERAWLTRRNAA